MNTIIRFLTSFYCLIIDWLAPTHKQCSHCLPQEAAASANEPEATEPIDHELCPKHTKLLSGIKATILFEARDIGTAYNLAASPNQDGSTSLTATSLVFRYDGLDRLFLNGVVDHAGQKMGFALHLIDDTSITNGQYQKAGLLKVSHLIEVYLTGGQKPILTTYRGEEQCWVNQATMETMHPCLPAID
jgi:hypothetical protein